MRFIGYAACLAASMLCCEPAFARAADGYSFDRSEWDIATMMVTVEWVESHRQLEREAQSRGASIERGNHAASFAVVNPSESRCTIFAVRLEVDYRPELIGHELIHCFRGRFHKENLRYRD